MLRMKYVGLVTEYSVDFTRISDNVVQVIGKVPKKTKGFRLSREGKDDWKKMDYSKYKTVYREVEGGFQFSDNKTVYVEPTPTINFYATEGGTLDGAIMQTAKDYSELFVPTPIAEENYTFSHWSPEIPESGKIDCNKSFTAIFMSTLPDPEPGPTLEERVAAVEEQNATLTMTVDSILTDVIPGLME